jgi:GT2 family glycosyltransferase
MNKVSIIIINYNSSEYTIACLKSIFNFTPVDFPFEIIVVDNNSLPADYEKLKNAIPDFKSTKLLRSNVNLGFSGGNMLGVKSANAEYFYFLNNDCELLNDNLSILYNFMQISKDAGICTGQMFRSDHSFHHSFNYFPGLKLKIFGSSLLRAFSPSNYPSRKINYDGVLKVPFVTGAAMFVDSNEFSKIGGLDTNFFLYCEEEDICYRLKKTGHAAYLVPEARFIHHIGKSSQRNFLFERENCISLLYFFRKHYSYPEYLLLKAFYFFKFGKKFYRSREYLKLAFFILKGAPMKYSLRYSENQKT